MNVILTSISPKHANANAQAIAIASWIDHGYTPVSLNSAKEVEAIRHQYPGVQFVATEANSRNLYKQPYVLIDAFIDYARAEGLPHAMIVNSDIAISDKDGLIGGYLHRSSDALVFSNRFDHNGDGANPTRYDYGFDAFIVNERFYNILPRSLFAMGQTWWDYWLPYRFIKSGVPAHLVKEPLFLHHRHPTQYDQKEWERMTEHFVWMDGYGKKPYISNGRNAQVVTNEVYRLIRSQAR